MLSTRDGDDVSTGEHRLSPNFEFTDKSSRRGVERRPTECCCCTTYYPAVHTDGRPARLYAGRRVKQAMCVRDVVGPQIPPVSSTHTRFLANTPNTLKFYGRYVVDATLHKFCLTRRCCTTPQQSLGNDFAQLPHTIERNRFGVQRTTLRPRWVIWPDTKAFNPSDLHANV